MIHVDISRALVALAQAIARAAGYTRADFICTNDLPEAYR